MAAGAGRRDRFFGLVLGAGHEKYGDAVGFRVEGAARRRTGLDLSENFQMNESTRKWTVAKTAKGPAGKISKKLGVLPLVARLLVNRGIRTVEEAETFLCPALSDLPSPFLMKGMDEAVERLRKAVYEKEKIAVYGDFDVDGVAGTSLLRGFLSALGCDVAYYIPDRFSEGYGVNSNALRVLRDGGTDLVVSVDCGITAADEVKEATELGMDFIVTDHHSLRGELPQAAAVVNPKQPGCNYPDKSIAGVGVAFNLAMGLRRTLREEGFFDGGGEPNLGDFLDLVSLGTVSDCVPLAGANRIMLSEGLLRMNSPKRPGLAALMKVSGVGAPVEAFDIGFRLGPRINAAGRLGSASDAVSLLVCEDPAEARSLAESLDRRNAERKEIEERIRAEAVSMVEAAGGFGDDPALVLCSPGWHRGVLGIVASSLCELYEKPVFLVSVDEAGAGRGSGRSFGGVDIFEPLCRCSELLAQFGGHRLAAGISIEGDSVDVFRKRFCGELSKTGRKPETALGIDSEIDLGSVTGELVSQIERLAPFGEGNPEPLFLSRSVGVENPRVMKERHVSFDARGGGEPLRCVWFYPPAVELPGKMDMVFAVRSELWRGERRTRLFVRDARAAGA